MLMVQFYIHLYGIKNDYEREGFKVHVVPSSTAKLDPVCALKSYWARPVDIHPEPEKPVFLSLTIYLMTLLPRCWIMQYKGPVCLI